MRVALLCGSGRTSQDVGGFCASALEGLGHEAALWHDNPRRGRSVLPAPLHPLLGRAHHALLAGWLQRRRPELVLVIKGENLVPERIAALRRRAPVPWVNWWIPWKASVDMRGSFRHPAWVSGV